MMTQVLWSQDGFNKTYAEGVSLSMRPIGYDEGIIYISGIYRRQIGDFQSAFVTALDTFGRVLWWHDISDENSSLAVAQEAGLYVIQGYGVAVHISYLHRWSIGMVIIDKDGNNLILNEFPMGEGNNATPYKIVQVHNGFLLTGRIQRLPVYPIDAFVLKTDLDGNMLWMRTYGHPLYEESTRAIVPVDENTVVLGGTRYQRDVFYHGWALAIDSTGNVLWEWEASEEEIPHRRIMDMQYDRENKEWVYLSFLERKTTHPGENYTVTAPVFVRRDSMMNLLNYYEYGPYAIRHIMVALEYYNDQGWIAAGQTTMTNDTFVSPVSSESGRVIKIAPDGTLVWSVIDTAFYHPELGSRSYLSGVTASPSGSVYASGWAMNYDDTGQYRSFGWLLKITADGCVDTLCTTTSLIEQIERLENPVRIYPNPAHDHVTIDAGPGMKEAARMHFYDITGRIISSLDILPGQTTLDTGYWPRGVYFWRVVLGDGVVLQTGKLIFQ